MWIEKIKICMDLIDIVEREIDSLLTDENRYCKKIADVINKYLVPDVEKKFNVKAEAVVERDYESGHSSVFLIVRPNETSKDVDKALEIEDRYFKLIDEYLINKYREIYPKAFSLMVITFETEETKHE